MEGLLTLIVYNVEKHHTIKKFFKNTKLSVFFVFLDGNLGDDSEEEGTVMLNLDQVCDEKPVK